MDILTKKPDIQAHTDHRVIFDAMVSSRTPIAIKERKAKIHAIARYMVAHKEELRAALMQDMHRPHQETDLTELYAIVKEARHVGRYLSSWARPKRVATPLAFQLGNSWIQAQPKGICLIISPWNFPINLCLVPLIDAIAAGNRVMLKPSEFTPHSVAFIKGLISEIFTEKEVAVVEGGPEISQELLTLPFNHIFFTGSTAVGKIVMEAAANRLTPVSLELGGKNPVIVDPSADLEKAVHRIGWTKFINCGQMCVAPDYAIVHSSLVNDFMAKMKTFIQNAYGEEPKDSPHLGRIINQKHFDRLLTYIQDARESGAEFVTGGSYEPAIRYIAPSLVQGLTMDNLLMKEEVFGPILPVIKYDNTEEIVEILNAISPPLGVYLFSKDRRLIQEISQRTRSGSVLINQLAAQYYHTGIGFGGVGASGIGKAHGKAGFEAFSDMKGYFRQRFTPLDLLAAPYNKTGQFLLDLAVKWL